MRSAQVTRQIIINLRRLKVFKRPEQRKRHRVLDGQRQNRRSKNLLKHSHHRNHVLSDTANPEKGSVGSADIRRVIRSRCESRPTKIYPRACRRGLGLHLIHKPCLRVPIEEQTLRTWTQVIFQHACGIVRVCALQILLKIRCPIAIGINRQSEP